MSLQAFKGSTYDQVTYWDTYDAHALCMENALYTFVYNEYTNLPFIPLF